MPITSTGIEYNCQIHGTVKARQYNIGNAELEYYGCGYCREPKLFPLSSRELRIKTPDQLLTEAQAEIARLQAEVERLRINSVELLDAVDRGYNKRTNDIIERHASEMSGIIKQRNTAWNDAIEAAAGKTGNILIKAAIRALRRPAP